MDAFIVIVNGILQQIVPENLSEFLKEKDAQNPVRTVKKIRRSGEVQVFCLGVILTTITLKMLSASGQHV